MREAESIPGAFHRAEDGMITVSAVVAVFGFAVLAALVGSVGAAVNRKVEAQNAADAVALSCSVQRARTLNAVTAVNHLTGELMAVVVLQEALGGENPGGAARDTAAENAALKKAMEIAGSVPDFGSLKIPQDTDKLLDVLGGGVESHNFAAALARALADYEARTPAYITVKGDVTADHALLDAKRELKYWLAFVYRMKAKALFMIACQKVPLVGPALYAVGVALYEALTLLEELIKIEWDALGWVQSFAETTRGSRDQLYQLVPRLRDRAKDVLAGTAGGFLPGGLTPGGSAGMIPETAAAIGKLNNATGAVFPESGGPSVAAETIDTGTVSKDDRVFWKQDQGRLRPLDENFPPRGGRPPERPASWSPVPPFARSQLVRATYPWVNFHRKRVFELTKWLLFADFPKHYRNWTTEVTLRRSQAYYRDNPGARLFVLEDLNNADRKDQAPWLDDTRAADRAFALVGAAHRAAPVRWTTRFLPATNPGGTVAVAQSLLYNANPRRQPGQPDDANYQPVTGWDTLNWNPEGGDPARAAAPEWPRFKKMGTPRVRLNWQAKLVPVSRLAEVAPRLGGPFAGPLGRLDPTSPLSHGH